MASLGAITLGIWLSRLLSFRIFVLSIWPFFVLSQAWHWIETLPEAHALSLAGIFLGKTLLYVLAFRQGNAGAGWLRQVRCAAGFVLVDSALEYTSGSSFGSLAYAWAPWHPINQIAALGGFTALTFFVTWTAAWIADLPAPWKRGQIILPATLAALAVLSLGRDLPVGENPHRLLALDATHRDLNSAWPTYLAMAAGSTEWIVLPELAFALSPGELEALSQRLSSWAKERGSAVLLGAGVADPMGPRNLALWADPVGSIGSRQKALLAPGEQSVAATISPATIAGVSALASVLICAESESSIATRRLIRPESDLIILIAKELPEIEPLHSYIAIIRAIESGRPLAKVSKGGAIFGASASGNMHGFSAPAPPPRMIELAVPRAKIDTLFFRWGNWLPLLCALFVLSWWFTRLKRFVVSN